MNRTHIQWCDYTSNPIKYRDASEVVPYFDEAEAKALLSPKRLPAGSRVFVGDMTDVFGEWVPAEMLDRLFAVFALRPDVVFQILTKRPERMRAYLSVMGSDSEAYRDRWDVARTWLRSQLTSPTDRRSMGRWEYVGVIMANQRWPLPNVWAGTSIENQPEADERIRELLACPAAVHYLSCEPLLAPVEIAEYMHNSTCARDEEIPFCICSEPREVAVDWVIVGGESGPGARPCDIGWIRSIVGQCQAASVPVFVKQDSGSRPGQQGRIPNELWLKEFPR